MTPEFDNTKTGVHHLKSDNDYDAYERRNTIKNIIYISYLIALIVLTGLYPYLDSNHILSPEGLDLYATVVFYMYAIGIGAVILWYLYFETFVNY